MANLAINGGEKLISKPFRPYSSLGEEEVGVATQVVRSGVLSDFVGEFGSGFRGGIKVKEFELACQNFFNVKQKQKVVISRFSKKL